jgi:hypothetical protein
VRRLLRPDREVERLERRHLAPVELLHDIDDPRLERELADLIVDQPCVLNPLPVVARGHPARVLEVLDAAVLVPRAVVSVIAQ